MINESLATHESQCMTHPLKRVCWTAIFVGALVAVGLGFLLNLFGIAIGLSAVTVSDDGGVALAIGGVIGVFIAVIVSMLVAGYAAGYLGRAHCANRNLGILYGFVTWSLALLLSAFVVAHVNQYVAAYAHTLTGPSVTVSQDMSTVNMVTSGSPNTSANEKQQITNAVATPSTLACGAFLLFALFFVGAISTCVGACCAMNCKKCD